jgi:hypothetical protein
LCDDLVVIERPRRGSRNAESRRSQTDERRDVERDAFAFDEREERIERRPLYVESIIARVATLFLECSTEQRCDRRAAITTNFGGDTLADLPFAAPVDEPKLVRVGMDIDESRRKSKSFAGNALTGVAIRKVTNRDDFSVCDSDIGGERCATESVVDTGALKDRPEQRLT